MLMNNVLLFGFNYFVIVIVTFQASQLEIPDVSERKAFLEGMGCGNFEWFMREVYPDLYIVPYKEIILHGEVRFDVT